MYTVEISQKASRIVKKLKGEKKVMFEKAVEKLKLDPFEPSLKTHKLGGKLENFWSARMDYSDRVIFILIIEKRIVIMNVGSHDLVYRNI